MSLATWWIMFWYITANIFQSSISISWGFQKNQSPFCWLSSLLQQMWGQGANLTKWQHSQWHGDKTWIFHSLLQCRCHIGDWHFGVYSGGKYSGTSLKGLSELRTQYKKPPIKDKFCSPNGAMLIHFYLWKSITAKMTQKWLVPKCPL